MPINRRTFLTVAGMTLMATPSIAAETKAVILPERAIGDDKAPVTVSEYFSLTCTHCAAFAKEVFPDIKSKLIDTGKIRYVFKDFPLDQVALKAAMVARSLPSDRYEPFIMALFSSQDRWAFAEGSNTTEELAKMAAFAGMPRPLFDAAISDNVLKQQILAEQQDVSKRLGIDSTPTFIFDGAKSHGAKHAGEMTYDDFLAQVTAAG